MGTTTVASRSLTREISTADGKPLLRGIHHLALVTDNMRMTLDFYVRVLGMPIVHGLRTPSRPPGASHAHGNGAPPYANIPHYFLDMGGDSLLAFFEYPEGVAKVDRDAIGAMQHVSFACGPRRYLPAKKSRLARKAPETCRVPFGHGFSKRYSGAGGGGRTARSSTSPTTGGGRAGSPLSSKYGPLSAVRAEGLSLIHI